MLSTYQTINSLQNNYSNLQLKELLISARKGEKNSILEFVNFCKLLTKNLFSKYLFMLKKFGFTYDILDSYYSCFIHDFITETELNMEKIAGYLVGYIQNKFRDLFRKYTTKESITFYKSRSLSEPLNSDGSIVLEDTVSGNENILEWYNSHYYVDKYINNSNDCLNEYERELISYIIDGYKFSEVANMYLLPYSQVLCIYKSILEKIRSVEAINVRKNREKLLEKIN